MVVAVVVVFVARARGLCAVDLGEIFVQAVLAVLVLDCQHVVQEGGVLQLLGVPEQVEPGAMVMSRSGGPTGEDGSNRNRSIVNPTSEVAVEAAWHREKERERERVSE
jgi:hypothetical protein